MIKKYIKLRAFSSYIGSVTAFGMLNIAISFKSMQEELLKAGLAFPSYVSEFSTWLYDVCEMVFGSRIYGSYLLSVFLCLLGVSLYVQAHRLSLQSLIAGGHSAIRSSKATRISLKEICDAKREIKNISLKKSYKQLYRELKKNLRNSKRNFMMAFLHSRRSIILSKKVINHELKEFIRELYFKCYWCAAKISLSIILKCAIIMSLRIFLPIFTTLVLIIAFVVLLISIILNIFSILILIGRIFLDLFGMAVHFYLFSWFEIFSRDRIVRVRARIATRFMVFSFLSALCVVIVLQQYGI